MSGENPNQYKERLSDKYVGRFSINGRNIMFDDKIFATVGAPPELPDGFSDRVMLHLWELLTSKRTEVWDAQVVYGSIVKPSKQQISSVRDQFREPIECVTCGHLKEMCTCE